MSVLARNLQFPFVKCSLYFNGRSIFSLRKFSNFSSSGGSTNGNSKEQNSLGNDKNNNGNGNLNTQFSNIEHAGLFTRFSVSRGIEKMILTSKITKDIDLARFLGKAAAISIYSLAGITVLGTLGVDTNPLLAGVGVTGFTIGFALKEIATNFLSGVMLVFNKPFQKGQYLRVLGPTSGQSLEGIVESIDARYVLLKNKDKGIIMVPSVVVYTNPIAVMNPPPFPNSAPIIYSSSLNTDSSAEIDAKSR